MVLLLIHIMLLTLALRLLRIRPAPINIIRVLLQHLLIHVIQQAKTKLQIRDQLLTPALRKVLTDHDAQHLHLLRIRRHRIRRHDPAALAQLMRNRKLIVALLELGVKTERHERQTTALALAHDQETHILDGIGEQVGGAGEVEHDRAVSVLAEADELVVLADDLGGALGEVEGEGCLVRAEVVDVEDEFLGEELGVTPDNPADTGVYETVLVARDVDADDVGEAEIPLEFGNDEGGDEAAGGSVDVDGGVEAALLEEVVDGLYVFVLARVGGAEDDADSDLCLFSFIDNSFGREKTYGVLVDQVHSLLRIKNVSVLGAVHVLLVDLEVAHGLLPDDLHSRGHNHVGLVPRLPFRLAPVLPALLHGQRGQHDGLGGSDGRGAN